MTSLQQAIDKLYANSIVNENGCWLWLGGVHEKGYGRIGINGRVEKTHRASFLYYRGAIIEGVFHTCDTPNCWNPDHLFTGINADNVKDKVAKGRQARGASHGKLTEEQVLLIRASPLPKKALGRLYGVAAATIWAIKNRKSWRHLNASEC